MDQEFQLYITKIQCQSQEDLDIARICFESIISNFDYGPFLLEKSHSDEFYEYNNAILCFRSWVRNFWQDLEIEQKQKIIETLLQLISINKSISTYIFDIFIFVIKHDDEMRIFFQDIISSLLKHFDLNERLVFENLLYFLLKLFQITKDEESLFNFYAIFRQYIYPIFNEISILENDELNSSKIFDFALQCFSVLFFQTQAELNDIIQPIEFSNYVISNCNDTKLVSRCSLFYRQCYESKKISNFLESIKNEILDLHINNINRFIQKEDDCVVYDFLRTIHIYGVKPECFEIFLASALLTNENINDFHSNPFVFYSLIYSSSCYKGPRGFALTAIDTLLKLNQELIQNLRQLEINELSMRVFGFLSTCRIKINEEFKEIHQSFIEAVLPMKFDNLVEISSKIYLILRSLDSGLIDDSYLIELFFEYFDIPNDVIHSLLCKIVCKMNSFVQEIPIKICLFLPTCHNLSALKALNNISKKQPEILIDTCESIIMFNKTCIEKEFNSLEEDEDDVDSGKIYYNLKIMSVFKEQFIQIVPLEEITWIIDHILRYNFNEDTLYDSIIKFINGIFEECSKYENEENYFLISQNIMMCILQILDNIEWKSEFIDIYSEIFLFPISNNKIMFLSLEASSTLIELCINIMNSNDPPILDLCDIISFIVQIDQSVDSEDLIQFCLNVFSQESFDNPLILLGSSDILASIIVTRNDCSKIPSSIFLSLIENNFYVRIYDKHLTAAALLFYEDESLKLASEELNKQELNQKNMSEDDYEEYLDELNLPISIKESFKDYPFPAPIQL